MHPLLYGQLLDMLVDLNRKDKLSLLPTTIFQLYHRKLRKAA